MNKQIRFINEPVIVSSLDGETTSYIPTNITTNREAYSASLDMIFKHVADLHIRIIEIIADKYNLDSGEIINEVINNPMYINMQGEVNGMGYVDNTSSPPLPANSSKNEESSQEKEVKKVVKRKLKVVSKSKNIDDSIENLATNVDNMSVEESSQNKKRNIA